MSARRAAVTMGWAAFMAAAAGANARSGSAAIPTPDLADITFAPNGPGQPLNLAAVIRAHRLTAVVFVSSTCRCFAVHRARLAALVGHLQPRDVRFVFVDSEPHPPGQAALDFFAEASQPIFRDQEGRLARRLNAASATETFVFDAAGTLRYRGGLDDDRTYLRPAPRNFLRDELLDLLDGTAPPFTTTKTLGCALRLR